MRVTEAEYQALVAKNGTVAQGIERGTSKATVAGSSPAGPTKNKFGAVKTTVDGITFDSKREAARYRELKLAERVGLIKNLQRQVRFPLVVDGALITTWVADFVYDDRRGETWVPQHEDCKGVRTREYKLKRKLVKALYGWDIRET